MKKKQQHPGGAADPWPHGAPLGGAPPGLGSWKRRVSLLPFLRFSLRDYGFCMATLLVFCLGSLFYQLSGGPPRFLLDLRQYLGKEGWQARGWRRPREVVPGGEGTRRRLLVLPPPTGAPRLPRWDAREHHIAAAARGACCLARRRLCAQRRGRHRGDRPGRYPAAGHRMPSPPPPPHLGRNVGVGVCGCVRVGVYSGPAVCRVRRGEEKGQSLPGLLVSAVLPCTGGFRPSSQWVLRILPHKFSLLPPARVTQGQISGSELACPLAASAHSVARS